MHEAVRADSITPPGGRGGQRIQFAPRPDGEAPSRDGPDASLGFPTRLH